MKKKALEFLIHFVFIVIIAAYFTNLFYQQTTKRQDGTLNEHIRFAENMYNGEDLNEARSLESLPHVGYFYTLITLYKLGLGFKQAAILVLSGAELLSFIIAYASYRYFLKNAIPDFFIVLAATVSIIISSLYLPWINPSPYFGQGSPNVHHNSTVILLKPIASLAFFMILSELQRDKKRLWWIVLSSFIFAFSILIKASFAIVLIPALGFWLLFQRRWKENLLWGAFILLPSILMLLFQYLSYFQLAQHHRGMKLVFFDVWLMHSPNIPVSILQALAFPLLLSIIRWSHFKFPDFMLVAWLMTIFGIIQFAFLAETLMGETLRSGNWISGLLMGLSLLYTLAILEVLAWTSELRTQNRFQQFLFALVGLLLLAHLYSGFQYDNFLFKRGRLPLPDVTEL
jgi:hypothetical protein